MKKDLGSVIMTVAKFLNKMLSEDEVEKLKIHLSIENMRENPSVNNEELVESQKRKSDYVSDCHFIGSGKIGGYKEIMLQEQERVFDKWIQENLKNGDFSFL